MTEERLVLADLLEMEIFCEPCGRRSASLYSPRCCCGRRRRRPGNDRWRMQQRGRFYASLQRQQRLVQRFDVADPAYHFGSTTTGCASGTKGLAQWTGSELEYCNGTPAWTSFL